MKKFLCLTLAAILVLGLFACGAKEPEEPAVFQTGYGRADVTPVASVPLGGYGQTDKRTFENILDNLYVSCVAFKDTEGTIGMVLSMDVISSTKAPNIRQKIEAETGVPQANIMVAATHTHSAPDQNKAGAFVGQLEAGAVEAAKAALADLAPTTITVGGVETERMNFVRHYLMNDGTYFGDNFGSSKSGYKAHAEEGDPGMKVTRFIREGEDKKDIVMVNFQAHPCMTGGLTKLDLSADFIGSTRTYVEYQTKTHFIYFTGAAGNQNTKSYISGETRTTDYNEYGMILGDYILGVLVNMTPAETGLVRSNTKAYTAEIDHTWDHLAAEAAAVNAVYTAEGRAAGNEEAHKYGISSVYHANAIINRVSMPATRDITVCTLTVGDLAFACAPYEMFAVHGRYIKENSPALQTMVLSCCNGANGYLPSNAAYDYGCYESHTGKFGRGTGDALAELMVSMITETLG